LARADGAQPNYDASTATCSNVYCHGNGMRLSADPSRAFPTPTWTGGAGQASCGGCHGVPPPNVAAHAGITVITQCVNCHAASVNADGTIKLMMDPATGQLTSTHIDGMVQCSSCP
jgi:predicted CxxxxCH...CXXCH cytochrome family protein